ncbi:hypothetical protein Sviol_55570 [Streptomyces violascens]|uniref:Uncharacterized protein n=1 Tax=Streptomyces violascens TaxID=67381 RepID=A0ABQ3QVA7_9ACTN|nr:hypothetical protein Sviol_55570 [Streptomyces violascens]
MVALTVRAFAAGLPADRRGSAPREATAGHLGERLRPHVLWLPQDQPHVVAYRHEVAEVVTSDADIVATPTREMSAGSTSCLPAVLSPRRWIIQAARSRTADGRLADGDRMEAAGKHLQGQLDTVAPIEIYLGPAAASRLAVIPGSCPSARPRCQIRTRRLSSTSGCGPLSPGPAWTWPQHAMPARATSPQLRDESALTTGSWRTARTGSSPRWRTGSDVT